MKDFQMIVHSLKTVASLKHCLDIASVVLDNPKFSIWSGSSRPDQHHYGRGGLAVHVSEVVDLCLLNNSYSCYKFNIDSKALFLAALFHDAGKMWDYEPTNEDCTEWKSSGHKYKIHHISRSALVWADAVKITNSCQDIEDDVLHAILSHHGQRAWGSPVEPKTKLAWMLHLCDGISARMDDCDKKYENLINKV